MPAPHPSRVVVAGGGVAGTEALLALRELGGDRCELTLVAPQPDFVYRPLAVAEPFGLGARRRYRLADVAADTDARFVPAGVAAVDDSARTVTLQSGDRLEYDALLLATGARSVPALQGAVTWDDTSAGELLVELLRDLESGAVRRLAVVAPAAAGWPLPAYELALLLARRARGTGAEPEIFLIAGDTAPLATFGAHNSEEIAAELEAAGVHVEAGVRAEGELGRPGELVLRPSRRRLRVDRILALPRLIGRAPAGVPVDGDGFVPVDEHGKVPGLERVWAAGDGVAFPVKHGGLAAAQADAAAAAIARLAGADVAPEPFRPVMQGELLTGRGSRRLGDEGAAGGGTRGKIAAKRLAPYLAARDDEHGRVAPENGYAQLS
jgi:sulfide:quinone oxidoreductase